MKLQHLCVLFLGTAFAVQKKFIINHWENCPDKTRLCDIHLDINQSDNIPNKILFSGYVNVSEKIPGPLELSYETNRCDLDMKKCEPYGGMKFPGICNFLVKSKGGFFSDVLNVFKPRVQCPLMAGQYKVENASVDTSSFSVLPVDGYRWISTLRISSGDGKNKKLAMCLVMESRCYKVKEKRKN